MKKGKIYWVEDDFSYVGYSPTNNEIIDRISNKIENIIIDDFVIKFDTIGEGENSYKVNLTSLEKEFRYEGKAVSDSDDDNDEIKVTCEFFENTKRIFLYGKWLENEYTYTWWVIVDKN